MNLRLYNIFRDSSDDDIAETIVGEQGEYLKRFKPKIEQSDNRQRNRDDVSTQV